MSFVATPEERARLTSLFHELGEDALEGMSLIAPLYIFFLFPLSF